MVVFIMKKKTTLKAICFTLLASVTLCACGNNGGQPSDSSADAASIARTTQESSSAELKKPEPDKSKEYIYTKNPNLTPVNYDSPALLGLTEDAGQEYIDKLTFICDSPGYWLIPFEMLKDGENTKQVWTGPENTQTFAYYKECKILDPNDKKEKFMWEAVAEHKPEYICIWLGMNGVSFLEEKEFISIYKEMIEDLRKASPESKFICMSINPIKPGYANWDEINNDKITKCNSWILKACEELGTHYVDMYGVIADDDGTPKEELMLDDLHMNGKGLELILECIRTHAYIPEE